MNKEKLSIVKTNYAINGTTTYCEVTFKFRVRPFIVAAFRNHEALTALKSNVTPNVELIEKNKTIKVGEAIFKVKGVAKCSPNDTYDETLGKRIAFSRAFITGHKKFKHIIDMCHDALMIKSAEMNNIYTIEREIVDREIAHLEELTHGEH